ncbi:hemagglutinin [Brenneria corticis]|uniref:Hemagglutinin n=2 Tax=Brenneria corticis TaxID=2173106 RepID=A0A2U1TMV3_9GAMM|nr:hemagglutinin [Brenneria sp. CFCC 11842]
MTSLHTNTNLLDENGNFVNTGGAYLGSKAKGEDPTASMTGNAVGTVIGNKVGGKFTSRCFHVGSEISGAIFGSGVGAVTGSSAEEAIKSFATGK